MRWYLGRCSGKRTECANDYQSTARCPGWERGKNWCKENADEEQYSDDNGGQTGLATATNTSLRRRQSRPVCKPSGRTADSIYAVTGLRPIREPMEMENASLR